MSFHDLDLLLHLELHTQSISCTFDIVHAELCQQYVPVPALLPLVAVPLGFLAVELALPAVPRPAEAFGAAVPGPLVLAIPEADEPPLLVVCLDPGFLAAEPVAPAVDLRLISLV